MPCRYRLYKLVEGKRRSTSKSCSSVCPLKLRDINVDTIKYFALHYDSEAATIFNTIINSSMSLKNIDIAKLNSLYHLGSPKNGDSFRPATLEQFKWALSLKPCSNISSLSLRCIYNTLYVCQQILSGMPSEMSHVEPLTQSRSQNVSVDDGFSSLNSIIVAHTLILFLHSHLQLKNGR